MAENGPYQRLLREARHGRQDQRTPLMKAASDGQAGKLRELLAEGAAVDEATVAVAGSLFYEGGQTALMYAARRGSADALRVLLDAGADPNAVADDGDTALVDAAAAGARDAVALLLERGAVLRPAGAKRTPLFAAASHGHAELVAFFRDLGADPNEPIWTGATPLHGAAHEAHLEAMRVLLDRGASVNARDTRGGTPLMEVADANLGDVELWMRYDEAATARLVDAARLLLDAGADVRARDREGEAALDRVVARTGDLFALARLLVERGADVALPNGRGTPPIVGAARTHDTLIVALLADAGAPVDARDAAGKTALDHATENGYADLIQLLSELGGVATEVRGIDAPPATRHLVPRAAEKLGARDYAAARALYEQIPASLRMRIAGIASNLGYCHQALGQQREAVECFDHAVARRPDLAHAYRAACYSAWAIEAWTEMQRFAERAVALSPDDDYAWQQLGIAAQQLDRPADAIAAYRRALAINPKNTPAAANLASLVKKPAAKKKQKKAVAKKKKAVAKKKNAVAKKKKAVVKRKQPAVKKKAQKKKKKKRSVQ